MKTYKTVTVYVGGGVISDTTINRAIETFRESNKDFKFHSMCINDHTLVLMFEREIPPVLLD